MHTGLIVVHTDSGAFFLLELYKTIVYWFDGAE